MPAALYRNVFEKNKIAAENSRVVRNSGPPIAPIILLFFFTRHHTRGWPPGVSSASWVSAYASRGLGDIFTGSINQSEQPLRQIEGDGERVRGTDCSCVCLFILLSPSNKERQKEDNEIIQG